MKKINLILCAVALVGTAFFASCSNESTTPTINFVTETTTNNKYSVTGSLTRVEANKTVTAGVASTTDRTQTDVISITKGYSDITWTESKVHDGNKSKAYTVSFNGVYGTTNRQVTRGSTTTQEFLTDPDEESVDLESFELYKIDDDFFFFTEDGQAVKATAAELESGEDFTLSLEYSVVRDNLGNRLSTDTDVNTTTTTYKYNLKFAAAK